MDRLRQLLAQHGYRLGGGSPTTKPRTFKLGEPGAPTIGASPPPGSRLQDVDRDHNIGRAFPSDSNPWRPR